MFSPDQPLGDYDFLVVPSSYADALPAGTVDLAINIESMQEMNQGLVDYYISYFDRRIAEGSFLYLVNSWEWLFKGEWRFPEHWETLFRHRTVRSWTADHPAEIFRKTSANVSGANRLRRVAFAREAQAARDYDRLRKLLLALDGHICDLRVESRAVVPANASCHICSCSRQSCRVQAENLPTRDVQVSRASSFDDIERLCYTFRRPS